MESLASIISVIGGIMKIVKFGMDNFGDQDDVGSTIKIAVGLDVDGGLNNAGGNLPDVRLFNEDGGFLGMSADPGDIGSGEAKQITVEHDGNNGQQATYALLSANSDAICIAFASITWPSGDKYAWIGDWGSQCGGSYYYSNYYIQGTNHKPDCLWLDSDGDQPQTGMQVHWPEFVDSSGDQVPSDPDKNAEKVDYLCNAGPPFSMYETEDPNTINYWIPGNGSDSSADAARKSDYAYGPMKSSSASAKFRNQKKPSDRKARLLNHLVIDDYDAHSAQALCDAPNSHGPDYVHVPEGKFCAMGSKTVYDLCSKAITNDCFDLDSHSIIKDTERAAKKYEGVVNWGNTAN